MNCDRSKQQCENVRKALDAAHARIAVLDARVAELEKALRDYGLRKHYVCEDCWYSCPKSGECCHDEIGDTCNCGAEEHNEAIFKILKREELGMSIKQYDPEDKEEWRLSPVTTRPALPVNDKRSEG